MNYFELLGLPVSFDIDEKALHVAYIQLQQYAHPDRMVGKSEVERIARIQQSMNGNEAYEALKSPLTRAQHLLALQGIEVNGEKDTVKPSPEILMEMMERREALHEATGDALAKAQEEGRDAAKACVTELGAAFAAGEYNKAAQVSIRLRYLTKLIEEAAMLRYRQKAAHG